MKRLQRVSAITVLVLLVAVPSRAATIFVTPGGTGDGSAPAVPANLQAALDTARVNGESDTLRLAAGEYDAGSTGASTFEFDAGLPGSDGQPVRLQGGWNADFTAQPGDWTATALDGGGGARVLWVRAEAAAAVANVTLENLTVRDGMIWGPGAGVYASQDAGGSVSLSVSRCFITGNHAVDSVGGAIAAQGPLSVEYSDLTFNRAYSGGAVHLSETAAPASFYRTLFSDNSILHSANPYGWQGCTLYSTSPDLTIDECLIHGMTDGSLAGAGSPLYLHTGGFVSVRNTAFRDSTNMYWGSAIGLWNAGADIYGCLFANNRSGAEPLLNGYSAVTYYNQNGGAAETIRIVNSTFVGNRSASDYSGDLNFRGGNLTVANCIFDDTTQWSILCYDGCGGTIDYSAVERGAAAVSGLSYGTHNTTAAPSFQPGDLDYKLNSDSPLIDAGSNASVPAWMAVDSKGAVRTFAVKDRDEPVVDMGWDEYVDWTLELAGPAPGTVWLNDGAPKTIAWTCTNLGGDVGITLWKGPREVSVKVRDIAVVPCADESYAWTLPEDLADGTDYGVVVTSSLYPAVEAGVGPFAIQHLKVLFPNGGQGLVQGSTYAVTWQSGNLGPGAAVQLKLYRGATLVRTIAAAAPNTGTYTWQVPYTMVPDATYRVKVSATAPHPGEDWSDAAFRILPAVTLTAPNGGQKIKRGTAYRVTWTYRNKPGSFVRLDLYRGGVLNRTIALKAPTGAAGKGSYLWVVPATQALGANYTIRVRSAAYVNCYDFSNKPFMITR